MTERSPADPTQITPDIPVTVIGGYLGSGKTTLVNHLLAAGTERVAVLVNDFGDVDIDAALIEEADGDTIALANGCICCSLVDGLAAALATIAGLDPAPDRLVIEASGVADPASVAAYGHGPGFALDAVVVLVDAETIRERAADRYVGDTVLRQLRSADIVVVNKVDLAGAAAVAEVEAWLGDRVDRALVVQADRARVDPAVLFGVVPRAERRHGPVGSDDGGSDDAGSDEEGAAASADAVFETWTWTSDRPLRRTTIEQLMEALPDSVVRAKGILWLDEDGSGSKGERRPSVLQRVGGRWSLRPVPPRSAAATTIGSRLVVIGTVGAIDDGWLADRLDR